MSRPAARPLPGHSPRPGRPRGAQSGLLDDRGGRSSSCGHGFVHDDLVDVPEHGGNQSKAQLGPLPVRMCISLLWPMCRRSPQPGREAESSRKLWHPGGALQRTAQPGWPKSRKLRKLGWQHGRPKARTAAPWLQHRATLRLRHPPALGSSL